MQVNLMNEKEAIEILNTLSKNLEQSPKTAWNRQAIAYFGEIVEWFQRRVDLMQIAETPINEWDKDNLPYVYRMGKWLQDEAHRELDAFILWDLGEYQLGTVAKQAKLSQQYLREAYKKKVVVE